MESFNLNKKKTHFQLMLQTKLFRNLDSGWKAAKYQKKHMAIFISTLSKV